MSKPVPPCADCGTRAGYTRLGYDRPIRRDGTPYGFVGKWLCASCEVRHGRHAAGIAKAARERWRELAVASEQASAKATRVERLRTLLAKHQERFRVGQAAEIREIARRTAEIRDQKVDRSRPVFLRFFRHPEMDSRAHWRAS
jgi:hypothetical protein